MDLTKLFTDEQFERGLESWAWIDLRGKQPIMASLFGDVFFASDDGFWFLDTLEGTIELHWRTRDALVATLSKPEGHDRYLLGGLAIAARNRGLTLGANEVYEFNVPPVLGGAIELDNIGVADIVVSLNIAGQIHDQVRHLPPGTRISEFTVDEPHPDETAEEG